MDKPVLSIVMSCETVSELTERLRAFALTRPASGVHIATKAWVSHFYECHELALAVAVLDKAKTFCAQTPPSPIADMIRLQYELTKTKSLVATRAYLKNRHFYSFTPKSFGVKVSLPRASQAPAWYKKEWDLRNPGMHIASESEVGQVRNQILKEYTEALGDTEYRVISHGSIVHLQTRPVGTYFFKTAARITRKKFDDFAEEAGVYSFNRHEPYLIALAIHDILKYGNIVTCDTHLPF